MSAFDQTSDAEAAAKAISSGDKISLAKVLNNEDIYTRSKTAHAAIEIVESNRSQNPNLPQVDIHSEKDYSGKEVLLDLTTGGTDSTAASSTLYHVGLVNGTYQRDYSFTHSPQKEYDTIDPSSGKTIYSDIVLPDGGGAHVDQNYDTVSGALSIQHFHWSGGVDEILHLDGAGNQVKSDVSWQRSDGSVAKRTTLNTFEPGTNTRIRSELTLDDSDKQINTYDAKGRLLTQDDTDSKGRKGHFEHQFDPTTDKLIVSLGHSPDGTINNSKYDRVTGEETYSFESYDGGKRQSLRETKYDPITHKKISYDQTGNYGMETHERYTPAGNLLSRDDIIDGKHARTDCQYDAKDNLRKRDELEFNGTTKHQEFSYDETGTKPKTYSMSQKSPGGFEENENDTYLDGKLLSEDFNWVKGEQKEEHLQYTWQPDQNLPGRNRLEISQTQIANDGSTKTYNYDYGADAQLKHNILHLHWSGSNADGSFSDDDEGRILRLQDWHLAKALHNQDVGVKK